MSQKLIWKRLLEESERASIQTQQYLEDQPFHQASLYDQLHHMSQTHIVSYLVFGFLLFALFRKLEIGLQHIFWFALFLIVVYYWIQKDYGDFMGYTKEKRDQLQFLNKMLFQNYTQWSQHNNQDEINVQPLLRKSYLHYHPYLVDFYYNVRECSIYNIQCYGDSLAHCNNMIGLLVSMRNGLENPFANYQTSLVENKKCINALKSVVYQYPTGEASNEKFDAMMDTLQRLLNGILKEMIVICKKKNDTEGLNLLSMPNDALELPEWIDVSCDPSLPQRGAKADGNLSGSAIYDLY